MDIINLIIINFKEIIDVSFFCDKMIIKEDLAMSFKEDLEKIKRQIFVLSPTS